MAPLRGSSDGFYPSLVLRPFRFDGLNPSLRYGTPSGLRWASPIFTIWHPFGASMGFTHLIYYAPSGLCCSYVFFRWASPIFKVWHPFGAIPMGCTHLIYYAPSGLTEVTLFFDGLHPSLRYGTPSGLLRWAAPI